PLRLSPAAPPPLLSPLSLHDALPLSPPDLASASSSRPNCRSVLVRDRGSSICTTSCRPRCPSSCRSLEPASGASPVVSWLASSRDRKSTCLNSSHVKTSYAVFCLKNK